MKRYGGRPGSHRRPVPEGRGRCKETGCQREGAQFAALGAPAHAVATAVTLQTSLGFALTAGSIALTFALVERVGWGVAFALLAVGPVFGIASMVRLKEMRLQGQTASADEPMSQGDM